MTNNFNAGQVPAMINSYERAEPLPLLFADVSFESSTFNILGVARDLKQRDKVNKYYGYKGRSEVEHPAAMDLSPEISKPFQ